MDKTSSECVALSKNRRIMFLTSFLSKRVDKNNLRRQRSMDYYEQLVPRFEESVRIDRNIFQIYIRGNDSSAEDVMDRLTSDFVENIEKLKTNNPDYKYQLLSDREAEQFILQYYGEIIWNYYQRIDKSYPAAKADLLRYLLLYARGGVYLDLKSGLSAPLTETIREDDRFLVFYWDNRPGGQHHYLIPEYIKKGEMLQAFIISSRGHPLLRKVIINVLRQIDQYNPYRNGVGWEGTLTTVGPVVYTKTIYNVITNKEIESRYREGKPWGEFGFSVYFAGEYIPGDYQKKLSMKDYRKSSHPVIICEKRWLQMVNINWLKVLAMAQCVRKKWR